MYECMYVCMYVCTVCMYVCMYVYMYDTHSTSTWFISKIQELFVENAN